MRHSFYPPASCKDSEEFERLFEFRCNGTFSQTYLNRTIFRTIPSTKEGLLVGSTVCISGQRDKRQTLPIH
jgi:hypothetical protein